MTKVFENNGTAFSAYDAATDWLKQEGYSVGIMQAGSPTGVAKGKRNISKWRNLGDDVDKLDGRIESDDERNGNATVILKD